MEAKLPVPGVTKRPGLLGAVRSFAERHPQIVAWIVLAIGMVAMLLYAARDVDLLPRQLAVLVVSTVGLAGLCVWIIGWERD
ncbi:MAG: hypothetical protein HY331_08050 [Chloroflexi bacterium]|nr:hypothetical protein [Chloroflexota bacterium]